MRWVTEDEFQNKKCSVMFPSDRIPGCQPQKLTTD